MNKVDLHIHSNHSDGSASVDAILELVKQYKLCAFSICDHDTFAAYEECTGKDIYGQLIKGIEVSCVDSLSNQSVHILGYVPFHPTRHIDALCAPTLALVEQRSLWQIHQLQAHGYDICEAEVRNYVQHGQVIYKQHILQVLIQKGYCKEIYGSLYQNLFKHQGICQKDITYPSVAEGIAAIHADGGIAILAHPFNSKVEQELLRYMELGVDGIEVYHSSHTEEQIRQLHAFVQRYQLLETGGSDFHGIYGQEPMLGEVQSTWCNEEMCVCKMKYWKAQYRL